MHCVTGAATHSTTVTHWKHSERRVGKPAGAAARRVPCPQTSVRRCLTPWKDLSTRLTPMSMRGTGEGKAAASTSCPCVARVRCCCCCCWCGPASAEICGGWAPALWPELIVLVCSCCCVPFKHVA